jgi:hypothetical protein
MRRSTLILILIAAVDVFFIGLMLYLVNGIRSGNLHTAIEQGAAIDRVVTTLGGAAGVISVLGLLAFAALRFMKN